MPNHQDSRSNSTRQNQRPRPDGEDPLPHMTEDARGRADEAEDDDFEDAEDLDEADDEDEEGTM